MERIGAEIDAADGDGLCSEIDHRVTRANARRQAASGPATGTVLRWIPEDQASVGTDGDGVERIVDRPCRQLPACADCVRG